MKKIIIKIPLITLLLGCNPSDSYLKNHEVFPYSEEIVQEKKYKISVKEANDLYVKYLYDRKKVKDLDYIFLAGYMRIISPYFLERYKKTILNLHPSLLPKFKSKDAIEQAFNAGEKEIGISIHYVNEELDGGEVIAQRSFEVSDEDTLETVTEKVHKLEHKLYPEVILKLVEEAL